MSQDLFGEFASPHHPKSNNVNTTGTQHLDDILGLFSTSTGQAKNLNPPNNLGSNNGADEFDDFGDFAEEPLPSANPSFGPLSNMDPPSPPSQRIVAEPISNLELLAASTTQEPIPQSRQRPEIAPDDDFGSFIFTPRIPTPPPQPRPFALASSLSAVNHLHPQHPPPALHILLPLLTSTLLSPQPFFNKLKPLPYSAKQRLLTSSPQVKETFTAVLHIAHVAGRLIAGRKLRGRRAYKSAGVSLNFSTSSNSKSDAMKDEREIAECVREYGEIVGSLRAVVRGMGMRVPDLGMDMNVVAVNNAHSTLSTSLGPGKVVPGSIATGKSRKQSPSNLGKDEWCWLCGIAGSDKVPKLNEEGDELTFSSDANEKWVNGWGHRSCRNWWNGCGIAPS